MSDERVVPWPHATTAASPLDVRAARRGLGVSQVRFARLCGFPLADLRRWERGEPITTPHVRVLITLIARDPDGARRAFANA